MKTLRMPMDPRDRREPSQEALEAAERDLRAAVAADVARSSTGRQEDVR